MKSILVSFVFLLVVLGSASAQLRSTPLEPGLHDYLVLHTDARVATISDNTIMVSGIVTEWVRKDQITLSASIANLRTLSPRTRADAERMIAEYNVSAAVGTLVVVDETLRMVHHMNPELATPLQMSDALQIFRRSVDEQRAVFARTLAVISAR